jgi:hypothetical protein
MEATPGVTLLEQAVTSTVVQFVKYDNSLVKLTPGLIIAEVEAEQITEIQKLVNPSNAGYLLKPKSVIAALYGSPSPSPVPTEAETILKDPVLEQQMRERAEVAVIALTSIRTDAAQWETFSASVTKKTKAIKNSALDQEAQDRWGNPFLSDKERYYPLATEENAHSTVHDGPELEAAAEAAFIPVEGDQTLDLSDEEFLTHQEIFAFTDGKGGKLYNTHPQLLLRFATRLLLYRHAGRFRLNYTKLLPQINGVSFGVNLADPQTTPYATRRSRYSPLETDEIIRQVMQLLHSGVLIETVSPWSADLVLAKKEGGSLRMCLNYRELNKKTKPMVAHMPQMSEVLQNSFRNGDSVFSQLDLSQAYHQVRVEQVSQELLAFNVPRPSSTSTLGVTTTGIPLQVTWAAMPFGLIDAPATFSSIMQQIFEPHGFFPYLDDLGYSTHTVEEHLDKLDLIMQLAAKFNLTFGAKCTFCRDEVKFLGHQVSGEGVRLHPKRIEAIMGMSVPRDNKEIMTYRGLINFCQEYMGTKVASLMAPMHAVLSKNYTRDDWPTEELQKVVDGIKALLSHPETLRHFEAGRDTIVVTDASTVGIGATLLQRHDDGWRPVFYLSKKLTPTQQRWNVTQLELFAVVTALLKWRIYLVDKPFLVRTDHSALQYLRDGTLFKGSRLQRWQMLLSEYAFAIEHHPGTTMGLPDALSRQFDEGLEESELIAAINVLPLPTTGTCNEIFPIVPVGVIASAIQDAHTTGKCFPRGTRVYTPLGQWSTTAEYHGTVRSYRTTQECKNLYARYITCYKRPDSTLEDLKAISDGFELTVDFDDGTAHVIKQSKLALSNRPRPLPGVIIPAPAPTFTPPGPANQPAAPPIMLADASGGGAPPAADPEAPAEATRAFTSGDVVHVFIGRDHRFAHLYGPDVLNPLGLVLTSTAESTTVRLLVAGQPELTLRDSSSLILVCTDANLTASLEQPTPVLYDGDVVMVKDLTRSAAITEHLGSLGIRSLKAVHGHAVGVITDTLSHHRFHVHFGAFGEGIMECTKNELVRLKAGKRSLLQTMANTAPLNYIFSPEELRFMDSNILITRSDAILDEWRTHLIEQQKTDPYLSGVRQYLLDGTPPPLWTARQLEDVPSLKKQWKIINQVLYRIFDSVAHPVTAIPESLHIKILELSHDGLEHFDSARTFQVLSQYFYWHGMREKCARYCASCLTCQQKRQYNFFTQLYGEDMAQRLVEATPGKTWAVDLHECPGDSDSNKYILVAKDLCTRYVEVAVLKNKDAPTVIGALYHSLILKHGTDIEIVSDQGSEFLNKWAHGLFTSHGIRTHTIKRDTPQENGSVERWNRVFVDHFRAALNARFILATQWAIWLPRLVSIYNNTYSPAIAHTPYFRLYNKPFHGPVAPFTLLPTSESTPEQAHWQAQAEEDRRFQALLLRNYQKHVQHLEIQSLLYHRAPRVHPGQLVLIRTAEPNNNNGQNKLRTHAGPFHVVRQDSESTYIVVGADQVEVGIHAHKIVPYRPSIADLAGTAQLAPSAQGAALSRWCARHSDGEILLEEF